MIVSNGNTYQAVGKKMATKNFSRAQEILNAARKLFAKKGYSLASMDELAKKVGITKPSLYYFFESKEHIYASILHEILLKISQDLEQYLAKGKAKKIDFPTIIYHVISDRLEDGIVIRLIDVKIIGINSAVFKEIRKTLERMRKLICQILRIYGVKNEKLAAEVLINSIHCYVLHANHNLVIAPAKEYSDYLASLFLEKKRKSKKLGTHQKYEPTHLH